VQFVDEKVLERDAAPVLIRPAIRPGIHHAGRAVDAMWLPARHRVRESAFADNERIVGPGTQAVDEDGVLPVIAALHRQNSLGGRRNRQLNALESRRPDAELHALRGDAGAKS